MKKYLRVIFLTLLVVGCLPVNNFASEVNQDMTNVVESTTPSVEEQPDKQPTSPEATNQEGNVEAGEVTGDGQAGESDNNTNFDETKKPPTPIEESSNQDTPTPDVSLSLSGHVQDIGWQQPNNQMLGTIGKALRLEGAKISFQNEVDGGIEYQAQVQDIGWQQPVSNGEVAGTTGRSLRLETIKIRLTGNIAKEYDVYYRAHVQNYGWLDWAHDYQPAGSVGLAYRLEAIEVKLVKRNEATPTNGVSCVELPALNGSAHVQNIGWQAPTQGRAIALGTTGQSLRLEALRLNSISNINSGLRYQTHIQDIGWSQPVNNNEVSGTTGRSLRLEAINISLTGELSKYFDIYYRTHIENYGWLGWTKNGGNAGSQGIGYRMEAIQIQIMPKGTTLPTGDSFKTEAIRRAYTPYYFNQRDRRWANNYYGRWAMGPTGCVQTADAMALSGILGREIQPPETAGWLYNHTNEFNKQFMGASGLATKQIATAYGVRNVGVNSLAELNEYLV